MTTNYDVGWKQTTTLFLRELMEFLYPQFAEQIDWSHPPESLEQELDALTPEHYVNDGVVDKLFKVRLKNGEEHYSFLHLEVQGKTSDFEMRMAKYMVRLFDKYGPKVFSVAILIDEQANWRPNQYSHEFWGCKMTLEYQVVKVLDYAERANELEESNNPFALVMLTHVLAWQKGTVEDRLQIKTKIGKLCIRKRFGVAYTKALLNFLDFLIQLPKLEEKRYHKVISDYDKEENTMYVPAYMEEQVSQAKAEGIQIGEAKGHKKGEADMLLNLLSFKFGAIPNEVREKINQASESELTAWASKIFAAQSIDELFN